MIAKQKIVQALIQTVIEADKQFQQGNNLLQTAKTNFQALGIDLNGTNLTVGEVAALIQYINDAQALVDSPVASGAKNKDVPSHSLGVLSAD